MTEIIRDEAIDNKTKALFANFRVEEETAEILIQKYGSERAYELAVQIASNPSLLEKKLDIDSYTSRNLAFFLSQLDFSPEQIDEAIKFAKEEAKKDKKNEQGGESVFNDDIGLDYSIFDPLTARVIRDRSKRRAEEKVDNMLLSKRVQNKNTERPTSKFNNAVRVARKEKFNADFPKLNRADFASDEEYRTALQEQYVAMKKQQWRYASVESALSYHNMARGLPEMNRQGLSGTTKKVKEAAMSIENQFDVYSDVEVTEENKDWMIEPSVENYSEGTMYNTDIRYAGYYAKSKTPDCALGTGKRAAEACENMGTYGNKNVMENVEGVAGATNLHRYTQEKYKNDPRYGNAKQTDFWAPRSEVTLEDAISLGKIGPGDMFSEYVGPNSGSSHHALTLVDVVKNEKEEIVSYTISDNNGGGNNAGTRIFTFKMGEKNPDNRWGNKKIIYTAVHKIKEDEFDAEAGEASIEQLEKMLSTTREEVVGQYGLIDQLATEEHIFFYSEKWMKTCGSAQKANHLGVLRNLYMMQYVEQNKELVSENLYKEIEKEEYKKCLEQGIGLVQVADKKDQAIPFTVKTVNPEDVKIVPSNLSEADRYAYEREQLEAFLYPKKDENFFDKVKAIFKGKETNKALSPELVEFSKAKIENLKYLEEQARLKESLKKMSLEVAEPLLTEDVRSLQSVQAERKQLEEYKKANKDHMSETELAVVDAYIGSLKSEEKFRKKMDEKGLDDDLHKSLAEVAREIHGTDANKNVNEMQTGGVEFKKQNETEEEPAKKTITPVSRNQGR